MNIFALIAIVLAIVAGTAAHFGVQRKWATVALSLVLFEVAFALQSIVAVGWVLVIR